MPPRGPPSSIALRKSREDGAVDRPAETGRHCARDQASTP
jgi:hypothetical protein